MRGSGSIEPREHDGRNGRGSPITRARIYFVAQAAAGALWWAAVFTSPSVRRWTLGSWSPALLVVPDVVLFVGASAIAGLLANRYVAMVCAAWTTLITAALVATALVEREAGWGAAAMMLASAGTVAAAVTLWLGRLPIEWFFFGPFEFRVTNDRERRTHLRRSLTQLVVFWTSLLIALPLLLAWAERRMRLSWPSLADREWPWIGAAVFLLASAFGLWSCISMALIGEGTPLPARTARKLVVVGPYRFVRNPMAVAGALQTIGVGLWLGSWIVILSAVAGAVIWNTFIRPAEEADLRTRFGNDYVAYAMTVRCWIPSRPTTARHRAT